MTYLLQTARLFSARMTNRSLLLTILYLLLVRVAGAQVHRVDSVRQLLNALPSDTSRVNQYYRLGELFERTSPDSALALYREGYALAQSIGFQQGEAAFSSYAIEVLNAQGKFKEALNIARGALEIYEHLDNRFDLAKALLNVGSEWHYLSDFEQASSYYLQALKIMDELNQPYYQRMLGNNLASVFIDLGQYQKGKDYAERSLRTAREIGEDYSISSSMFNVATAALYLKQYDEALAHYQEIEVIGKRIDNYIVVLDGWLGMADVYSAQDKGKQAIEFYNRVITFSKEKNAPEYEMYACMGAADVWMKLSKFREAGDMITNGIALATAQGSLFELKDLYRKASELAERQHELGTALDFRKKFEILNDSVAGEKSRSNIEMLEARFESEKKASIIEQLESDKQLQALTLRQRTILNIVFAGTAAVSGIILFLVFRNNRQKQSLQEQQILQLRQEKQLMATEAVLKGEERERARLAKDLHDGLGGMLSGLKHNLSHMKGNQIMTAENQAAFERGLDMLDRSIQEMRRVAHNMMPEALLRFGLDTALRDFCNDISLSGALSVSYQSFGMEGASIELCRNSSPIRLNTRKHNTPSFSCHGRVIIYHLLLRMMGRASTLPLLAQAEELVGRTSKAASLF